MTKLQLLHRALNERMMAAVEQIMEMVGGTVQEYEEETLRVRKENEVLKRRLQWMEETHRTEWPGEPVSIQEESTQSQTETSAISFEFPQEAQPVEIKSESTDNALFVSPMTTIVTLPQSTDLGPVIAGTSDSFNYVQNERLTWKSIPSYMEPLEFDPTSSNMVRCDSIRGKRQRMSFACPDCGKVFGREQGLLFHMRTHSTERPYMYRKRKVFYYGDRRRKRKLQGLSRLSRERVDNVLDGSEQANTDSPSTEEQEQEPGHSSSKSDQTSNNTVTEENTSNPVIPKEGEAKKKKRCPLCRQKFKRRIDFDIHLKSHMEAKQPVIYRREPKKKKRSRCQNQYPCSECDKVFLRPIGVYNHMKTHRVRQEKVVKQVVKKSVPDKAKVNKEETTKRAVPVDSERILRSKKKFPCPHCKKEFVHKKSLMIHIRTNHCTTPKSTYFDVKPCSGRTRSRNVLRECTTEAENVIGQSPESQILHTGSYQCPVCEKVYFSIGWLSKHMSFHEEINIHVPGQELENGGMETNEGYSSEMPSRENASEESTRQKARFETNKIIKTHSAPLAGTSSHVAMSHLSLHPRVVLNPLMLSRHIDTIQSVSSESCRCNLVQTSFSVSVNNQSFNVMEYIGHSNQNKLKTICSVIPKTENTIGLLQNDSESGFINQEPFTVTDDVRQLGTRKDTTTSLKLTGSELVTAAENTIKDPGGNQHKCNDISAKKLTDRQDTVSESVINKNTLGREEVMDDAPSPSKGYYERETIKLDENCSELQKQVPVILINNEPDQSVTQINTTANLKLNGSELMDAAEETLEEPEGTKHNWSDDNEDDAVDNEEPSPSEGFDENDLHENNHTSVWHSSDSQILNSVNSDGATCSNIKRIGNTLQKTDVKDESLSVSESILLGEGTSSQHKQVLDIKIESCDGGPNTESSVDTKKRKKSSNLRRIKRLRDTAGAKERVRMCLDKMGILPDVTLNRVPEKKRQEMFRKSWQDGRPLPHRYALLFFKSLIPLEVYQKWSGYVNFDGNRGKFALPHNVKKAVFKEIEQAFQHSLTPRDYQIIKDKINISLRDRFSDVPPV